MAMAKIKKSIIVFLVIFLLCGCSPTEFSIPKASNSADPTITPTNLPLQSETIAPEMSVAPEAQYTSKEYWGATRLDNQFEAIGIPSPSTIHLFIGENNDYIGFTYEFGYFLTEEDLKNKESFVCNKSGSIYVFFGKMTEISENIYSCSGSYLPSLNQRKNAVSEGIDFYAIEKDDKLYLIYDELSLNDLQNYTSESYAIFHDFISNEVIKYTEHLEYLGYTE